uniref:Tick transposon n=1 Tax=Rhipicephalus pulchellus TaxID=72859 RepID=L7LVY0_RHIPC
MLNRCLFLVQFFAGVAAPLVAASSMDLGASPTADRHVQPTACVRTDCPVLHPEDSHGSFVSMPAILQSSFIGDITYDSGLFNTPTGVTSTDKDIKAPPKLHRFSGEGRSSTSTMLNRCLFLVQFFAGVAAPLVAASSMDLGASPTADRHVQPTACVRTDCPVLHPEDSHGSFVSMPAILQSSFIGDITYDSGLFNTPTGVTSTDKDIKAPPKLHRFSGEGRSSTSTMLNRCLFLVQVCYLNNAYCFRSDDRCLLLVPCPHSCSFVFTSLYADIVHCLCSLLLSGDVELNPGPTQRSTRANTTNSSLSSRTAFPDSNRMEGSHTPSADPDNQCSVSEMFAQILSGQKKIEQDVAELRNSVNSRFEAIESRLAVLEQTPPLHNATLFDNLCCQIENLTSTVNKLSSRNDDLENRSRRNNIIIHGLEESEDENDDSLQASLKKFFSDTLKVDFPQIERFHRIGTYHGSKSRPVILRLLDFREKMKVLRNGFKLKGSKLRLTEDFSEHVRFIRKKLWDATASFRNNGSTVHLRYDHVYVDSERYDWN